MRKSIAALLALFILCFSMVACDPHNVNNDTPREVGIWMLNKVYHEGDQWGCLDNLWTRESNWQITATNPSSGAYGIPQSLPADKMASVFWDWRTSAFTQIKWGLDYINARYGGPCGAWSHSLATGWY